MKKVFTLLVTVFLFISSYSLISAADTTTTVSTTDAKPTLYVRQGCAHCAKVEAFLNTNKLNDKVKKIETYNNDSAQKDLDAIFEKYKVPNEQRGVPFMVVSETEYLVGDVPIIDYFAKKYNVEVNENDGYQTSASDTLFLIIGGGLVFAVLGYGLYSVFSKK